MTTIFVSLAFVVGIAVGVVLDDAWTLYTKEKKGAHMDLSPRTQRHTGKPRREISTNALGVMLICCCLALLAVGVSLIVTRSSTERYSQCTADWQQQFSSAYLARTAAAIEVSDSMDQVVIAVAAQDEKKFDEAVEHYIQVRDAQIKEQADNPLPPLPKVLCGEGS